ncbi:hypothetical protein BDZ94DRAFT_825714, partial [Collybia nuda]
MTSPPTSPPRAYGASCTTGGFIRGRAHGNALNHADLQDLGFMEDPPAIPQKGHVHIYANRERHGLPTFLKLEVTPTLGPVLESLSDVLSPVRRQNQRIFVFEETGWAIKG